MFERHAARRERASNQQAAVTGSRILLAAHDRDSPALHFRFERCESALKRRRLGKLLIQHMAVRVVKLGVVRVPAEFPAQEDVSQPGGGDRRPQRFHVVLPGIRAIGFRAHVNQRLDVVRLEQIEKLLDGEIRVTNRENPPFLVRDMMFHSTDPRARVPARNRNRNRNRRQDKASRLHKAACVPQAATRYSSRVNRPRNSIRSTITSTITSTSTTRRETVR